MRKIAILAFVLAFLLTSSSKVMAAQQCEWSSNSNGLFFCASGFKSEEEARSHNFQIRCRGNNCGRSMLKGLIDVLFGGQTVPITAVEEDSKNPGTYYSCIQTQGYSQEMQSLIDGCMKPGIAEKIAKAGCVAPKPGELPISLDPIGAIVRATKIPECVSKAVMTNIYNKTLQECVPTFVGAVRPNSYTTSCTAELPLELHIDGIAAPKDAPFGLCEQVGPQDRDKCNECVQNSTNPAGVWTAIGCIPTAPQGIIQVLIRLALGLGGGVTLLLILSGAFRLSISQGDPKAIEEAKEQITSAIIGLLFIIFSIVMLRFIGIQVLQIPGFGGS